MIEIDLLWLRGDAVENFVSRFGQKIAVNAPQSREYRSLQAPRLGLVQSDMTKITGRLGMPGS